MGWIDKLLPPGASRLIMFDLDGTLVNSVPDLAAAIDLMLQDLGFAAAGEARVRHWVGQGATLLVRQALAHALNHNDPKKLEEDQTQTAQARFFLHYEQHNGRHARLYPDVASTLARLRQAGHPLALITNKPLQFTTVLLRHLALEFDLVLGGDSLAQRKPHPAPLQHCLRHFGHSARHALMVGDSIHDIQAARAAGVPVACVSYGYNHGQDIREGGADAVIDSLSELL